ncbi:MAG: hypothetical protein OXG96_00145 [Acidobacteria bacterium]|nr:hypothetical protein [Acidobacteriota bacterium]
MATYTIDTHATIRELEDAGMDSRQAEVVVAAISRSDAELATKSDLKAEIVAVRSAIDKLEVSTKAGMAGLKGDLKIIEYFFGPAIVVLLLKIAFF